MHELERFFHTWEHEASGTAKLLRALPQDKYDFRPDSGGRSLGELAWHLAESDAYMTYGIEIGTFSFDMKPPHVERPRTIAGLAPGFEQVHRDAVARIKRLTAADLDRTLPFFIGELSIRDILDSMVIRHHVHHRGQLTVLCRLAGGHPPGLYGPTREEMAEMMKARGK